MPKNKAPKRYYERHETVYDGESGAPWVAYLKSREAEGWQLESAEVKKSITETRFIGKVVFRREIPLAYAGDAKGE